MRSAVNCQVSYAFEQIFAKQLSIKIQTKKKTNTSYAIWVCDNEENNNVKMVIRAKKVTSVFLLSCI